MTTSDGTIKEPPFCAWPECGCEFGKCQMRDADLRAAFKAHTEGQTHFTRRMAIAIADYFGLTPMQVVRRYERMGLLKLGSSPKNELQGSCRSSAPATRASRSER